MIVSILILLYPLVVVSTEPRNYLQQAHYNLTHNSLKDYLPRQRRQRLGSNSTSDPLDGLTWTGLRTVNGLRNSEVAFLIISTWARNGHYYRTRIIPSARTWMRLAAHVIVVIEDTEDARLAFRSCHSNDFGGITSFHCNHEPTVILSRVCDANPSSSGGICCKVDELVNYIVNVRADLSKYLKYAIIGDDDYFYRVDRVLTWLSYIEHAGVSHVPVISNGFVGYDYARDRDPACKEIVTYGWYGTLMLNRAALQQYGKTPYGLMKTCQAWGGAQDVNLGKFAWMRGFHHINFPGVEQVNVDMDGSHEFYLHKNMVLHHAYHHTSSKVTHPCDTKTWDPSMRFDQSAMTGCGSFAKPAPNSDRGRSMYQLWDYFATQGDDKLHLPDALWRMHDGRDPVPVLSPLAGYNTTKHAKTNTDLKQWQAFGPSDCENFEVDAAMLRPLL